MADVVSTLASGDLLPAALTAGSAGMPSPFPTAPAMPTMPTASTTLSALQGGFTAMSAVSSYLGGQAARQSAGMRAQFMDFNAAQESIAAERQAVEIERERLRKTGDARVAFAASGQLSSGASQIEQSLSDQADFEIGLLRSGAKASAAGKTATAASLRTGGEAQALSDTLRGTVALTNYALDLRRRG